MKLVICYIIDILIDINMAHYLAEGIGIRNQELGIRN